jgi:hypothetical protein
MIERKNGSKSVDIIDTDGRRWQQDFRMTWPKDDKPGITSKKKVNVPLALREARKLLKKSLSKRISPLLIQAMVNRYRKSVSQASAVFGQLRIVLPREIK